MTTAKKNQKTDARPILRQLSIFAELDEAEIARIASECQFLKFSKNAEILHAGDVLKAFYFVVAGQVRIFANTPDGHEKVIELVGAGQSFGEALMFLGRAAPVNVQSLEETHLLEIPKKTVLAEIALDSQFSLRLLAGMSRRLHGLVHDIQSYTLRGGVERVVGYLLRDIYDDAGNVKTHEFSLPVSKATIASRLSMTPEYFSRILHELKRSGYITIDHRKIIIHNPQALQKSMHNLG